MDLNDVVVDALDTGAKLTYFVGTYVDNVETLRRGILVRAAVAAELHKDSDYGEWCKKVGEFRKDPTNDDKDFTKEG